MADYMKMWTCLLPLSIILSTFVGSAAANYCPVSHKCSFQCTIQSRYTTKCGVFGWKRCTRYRTVYQTCYKTCYTQHCCAGYTGASCSTPICSGTESCLNGGTCSSPGVCSCPTGYLPPRCTEINECATDTHGCQHNCVNTDGSYYCTCRTGYTLNTDQRSCIDVNECTSNNGGCSHNCINTVGSFKCGCRDGYSSSGYSCSDENECQLGTAACSQKCTNLIGSYQCSCYEGYWLDIDDATCVDIDECSEGTDTCEVYCNNTIGSYSCSCDAGYDTDGDRCLDIDECTSEPCDQLCFNKPGSYQCDCESGYRLNDASRCHDIDECAEHVSGCSNGCTNHEGSYSCTCPSGYVLSDNGFTCEDIDECQNVECQHGGECSDGLNSFTCICSSGYTGTYCETDLDECLDFNGGCEDNCTNTEGSFNCSCFDDRVLQDDRLSCSGGTANGVTVFEKRSIAGQLLAKPCFEVLLTRCIDGTDIEVRLASTSEWYTLEADQNTFYTFGISYVTINSFSVPVSLKGIKVSVTSNSFEFSHNPDFEVNDGTLKDSDLTSPGCEAYVFDESEIFDFISADSFLKTFLWSLFPQLPDWLQFGKSNHPAIAVQDMKSDLIYGRNVDTLTECSGAPVIDYHLYSMFRFDSGFSLEIYGTEINLPSLLEGRKFCIIADLCQDFGGSIFLMIPAESRDLLLELPVFKSLKDELNLQIKPRGIGLSLMKGINVDYQQAMQVWNGDHMFQYSVIRTADLWIGGEVEKNDKYFSIEGSADMYFDIPNIETMFTSLFRDEWNGLVEIKASASPIFRFKLFGKDYAVKFTIATTDIDAYVSIGGTNRLECGENSNPAGLFFSVFININPFMDVPILKDWFKSKIRVYGFVSKGSQEIPTSIDHFSEAILQIDLIVNKTIDKIETSLNEFEVIVSSTIVSLLQTINEGLSIMQEIIDIHLPNAWSSGDINGIISSIERLRQLFADVKHTVKQFIAAVEFILNEIIESLVIMLRTAIEEIENFIRNILNSITESILKEVGDYTDFGLKCNTDITIFGLSFPNIDLEIVHSEGNLFQCSRFDSVIEFLDGEEAMRFLGRFPLPIRLGKFLKLETGGIGGALASNSNKVVFHFQAVASFLGIRATGDVFITSGRGLYFYVEGNIWNIFLAQIDVSAELGKKWHELTFVIEGRFVTKSRKKRQVQHRTETFQDSYVDGLIKCVGMVSDNTQKRLSGVQDSLTKAQSAFTKAQNWLEDKKTAVRNANIAFDKAVNVLESAKQKLEIAKGPLREAIAKLEAAQKNVDNLCRIRTCSKICIPGIKCKICHKRVWGVRIPYPCCRFTSCMISFPNPLCVLANIACRIIRGIAYLALEVAKIFVRGALLAFDIAQAALSVAQVIVDKSRVVLRIAEGILDLAQAGLEFAKGVLETAKAALEVVKRVIGAAAKVLQLVLEYGLKSLLDVRNCRFKVEVSTKDLPVFDVSCEVNAFRLGWTKVQMTINFKNILQSIWQAARATISALMKTLGNVFGRKRRSVEFEASSKVHRLLRILRQADDFEQLSQNDTIDVTDGNEFNLAENVDAADRIRSYDKKCRTMQILQAFLHDAFEALQDTVNYSKSYLNDIRKVKDDLLQYNSTDTEAQNITAEDIGINAEYAANDYNMTEVHINIALEETKLSATNDTILLEIKNAANSSLHNVEMETKSMESIDFVNIWYTAMDNITKEYFNDTECGDFRDCMFYTISSFYELYEAEEFPNVSSVKQSILDLEHVVIESFQNETNSITETSDVMELIVNEINRLTDMNPFCLEAPIIHVHPKNVTVLLQTVAKFNCFASGDPEPSYWWYKDDVLLPNERTNALTLTNISESDNGTRLTCVAGNIVANISSLDAYILTADSDSDECVVDNGNCEYDCVNTIGSYYCVCPEGFNVNETDGLTCTDTNECDGQFGEGMCEQLCNNNIGGYNCSCNEGYVLGIDGFSCDDINECAVDNGGCGFQCVNLDGSFHCICNEGYVGSGDVGLCIDEDECEVDNGGCEQTCINTEGSFRCECLMGYEIDTDNTNCNDIDECLEDNGGCEHRCDNIDGAYSCSCSLGYDLEEDLHLCSDTDECQTDNGDCTQQCNNTQGSFFCECDEGYELDSNGIDCLDIDECNVDNGGCGQLCLNHFGSFGCNCNMGYKLAEDGSDCLDIDECHEDGSICEHVCVNSDGGFSCRCEDGYVLAEDKRRCEDINECLSNDGGCESHCTNKIGTFTCSCDSGYVLDDDGSNCTDANECLENNGGCEHYCTNLPGSYECNCMPGFKPAEDDSNCVDIDECILNTHNCEQGCSNTDGSYSCTCRNGFVLDDNGFECVDIIECNTENGGCAHTCTNTDGSYTCECMNGYTADTDGSNCNDIDECIKGNGGCDQKCFNTEGTYYCNCSPGYALQDDLHQCSDIDECSTNNGGCEHTCINKVGSFVCGCNDGFILAPNKLDCLDTDECLTNNGGCGHVCTNSNGAFMCSCRSGYILADDGFGCLDRDECFENNGGCEHECMNTEGTFECRCRLGYVLTGDSKCSDLDECSTSSHGCEQECENNVGSFTCMCGVGYELDDDEFKCNDINECLSDNGRCDQLCMNTDGSFICDCAVGFVLDSDGYKCRDVNECSENNGGCEQICLNEHGSFLCACNEGYMLESDKRQCSDINECTNDDGGCSHFCENTPGSYQCRCDVGFSLNADNRNCEDTDECLMYNGGCHHECVNIMGSFKCSCKQNFIPDRFGLACLGPDKRSFQASVTIRFVLKERVKRSETLTPGIIKQSLEEFYQKYTSSGVTVVIKSMRTTETTTIIDYTVLYDETDSINLVHATVVLSSGTDITYDGVSVASRSYLPANITNECHILETYMEGCDQGQRCEISNDGPTCLNEVTDTTTSNYLVYILPTAGVTFLCIAIIFVIMCALCIRKRREKKHKRDNPDRERGSTRAPTSISGMIRHTNTREYKFRESPFKY